MGCQDRRLWPSPAAPAPSFVTLRLKGRLTVFVCPLRRRLKDAAIALSLKDNTYSQGHLAPNVNSSPEEKNKVTIYRLIHLTGCSG